MTVAELVPCSLDTARCLVALWHRRLPDGVTGHLWSTVAMVGGVPVGVVVVGRPLARHLDTGRTVEVVRLATPGSDADAACRNVCSMLYAAVWRAAKARGYTAATTMTEAAESGSSLRAAGWQPEAQVRPPRAGWDTPSRRRAAVESPSRVRWWAPGATHATLPDWAAVLERLGVERGTQPSLFDNAGQGAFPRVLSAV